MKLAYVLLADSKKFKPCNAPKCYCKMMISRPDKTEITKKLIENAQRCRQGNNKRWKSKPVSK